MLFVGLLFSALVVGSSAQVCEITLPDDVFSARALAMPFIVRGCNQSNNSEATFVQGGIVRTQAKLGGNDTTLEIYNPLIANEGQRTLPQDPPADGGRDMVVALWFGTNAEAIVLKNKQGCVDGFGQFAYCNAPKFFEQAKNAVPPPLGTAKDGLPCPTTRDFTVVDQDPSDNVATVYLLDPASGTIMAGTPANRQAHPDAIELVNGSDEHLLAVNIAQALGCWPFLVKDVLSGEYLPSLFANELSANALQGPPVALVPDLDPMVLADGQPDHEKMNSFRAGVFQPPDVLADTTRFCNELANATARMQLDKPFMIVKPSPNPDAADSLFTFLAFRFAGTWEDLTCQNLTGNPAPVTLTTDDAGIVVEAVYEAQVQVPSPTQNPSPTKVPSPTQNPMSPTQNPMSPTQNPMSPTQTPSPTQNPMSPTQTPSPTQNPMSPTQTPSPTQNPMSPTQAPSPAQAPSPTQNPMSPTQNPMSPTKVPSPTQNPMSPTKVPSPTQNPMSPTQNPMTPTKAPSPVPCPTQVIPTLPPNGPPGSSIYKFASLTLSSCWGAAGQATAVLNGNISPMPTAENGLPVVKITFSNAVTLRDSWNVYSPQTSGAVLSFALLDDQPSVGGIVTFPGLDCVGGAIAVTFSAQIG